MNKKYMMFGVFGLLAMALVSAGLVSYLSNTTQVDIDIASPLTLVSVDISTLAYGGEVVSVDSTLTNHISEVVNGIFNMTIVNSLTNVGCSDFDSIVVTENGVVMDSGNVECVSDGIVAIVTFPTTNVANTVAAYNVDLEFAQAVEPAHYDMTSVINVA